MTNIYQIKEVATGIAVVDTRTSTTINTWNPELRHMAVQFATCLNTLLDQQLWSKPIYA